MADAPTSSDSTPWPSDGLQPCVCARRSAKSMLSRRSNYDSSHLFHHPCRRPHRGPSRMLRPALAPRSPRLLQLPVRPPKRRASVLPSRLISSSTFGVMFTQHENSNFVLCRHIQRHARTEVLSQAELLCLFKGRQLKLEFELIRICGVFSGWIRAVGLVVAAVE